MKTFYLISTLIFSLFSTNSYGENLSSTSNEALVKIFEKTKKEFLEEKNVSTVAINTIRDLPLYPEESHLEEFPAPLQANETDTETLSRYYTNISIAYGKESTKQDEALTKAHEAHSKYQLEQELKAQRHDQIKLPDDITKHNDGHKMGDKTIPYKYSQFSTPNIVKDGQNMHEKRLREHEISHEKYAIKQRFYATIAAALSAK
ncbi:MAG: hypothetical protein KBB83_06210 [Alphaproteobacteria bacterium]|nr:hypothetical protein [Alphaproteobacteria bacterium]